MVKDHSSLTGGLTSVTPRLETATSPPGRKRSSPKKFLLDSSVKRSFAQHPTTTGHTVPSALLVEGLLLQQGTMNPSQPVSSSIRGVEFGFLGSDEIRALSVKRITNPTTFDTLLHPVPGGLYDSALGAFLDRNCATCGLDKFGCPGHCGHVELPVPVYHPTYMTQVLKLLRATCVYCHRFKMARVEVNLYICKLRLIRYGLLKEAEELEGMGSGRSRVGRAGEEVGSDSENDADSIMDRRDAFVKRAIKAAKEFHGAAGLPSVKTEAIGSERRDIIKQFMADVAKGKKCSNCNGINPSYRKDRYVKIFRKPLSPKDREAMVALGFKAENPMVTLHRQKLAAQKRASKHGEIDEAVADLDMLSPDEDEDMGDATGSDVQEVPGDDLTMAEGTAAKAGSRTVATENKSEFMSAGEVRAALVQLFEREQEILGLLYSMKSRLRKQSTLSPDMFFINSVLIPPNRYRPEARTGNDEIAEAQDNSLYKAILNSCELVNSINREIRTGASDSARGPRGVDDLHNAWVEVQDAVNSLIDRDRNPIQGAAGLKNADGIKQKLEKKEGLFRKNMMGKRVNFAARSVISPDPNIETNEIGVPPVFAKKLTYPEPVTNHNFYELKEAVLNGPDKWPGAVAIENENGQVINLRTKNMEERQALANQLLAPSNTTVNGARNKKVHRHLNNGDIVIMNRQPTLHKPSMMCHRARVLPGEKTIRMHYANCNTYNADFDGDEMNMHFPQNEVARAEAVGIADTDHQYLSSTAGAPLRGLIQDHLSMAVSLTNRDSFFTRDDYQQLLYAGLRPESNHTTSGRLLTLPPAVLKPRPLWTGKQVISTVLLNITPLGLPGITLQSKSKTALNNWGYNLKEDGAKEDEVIIREGELLSGIIDKNQIGPNSGGLVAQVYEAYGHTVAGRLLSILGRLLTKLLHMRAFSCGVEDLVLTKEGDARRKEVLKGADPVGLEVASKYVSLEGKVTNSNDKELLRRLEDVMRDDNKLSGLDSVTNNKTKDLSSLITKECLPRGLVKPFPKNQMQAMTQSGAKGSAVNANLISCNLGQQVLEGRRVPVMVSGKTLPCFKPFEPSIRAGGYIVDRFLTGVRPQEYFFHMMAGREGLIDTAVKTSRSGYLQRCVIKGMEGLKVEYDTSVRDDDGSMVQFLYGEDGLDTTKARSLTDFKFLSENFFSFFQALNIADSYSQLRSDEAEKWTKSALKKVAKTGNLAAKDTAISVFNPTNHAGSTSEKFYSALTKYCEENPDRLIRTKTNKETYDYIGLQHPDLKRGNFVGMLNVKYLRSLVEPGEAVGVVAGQSVGEPSTQMTLNTFHLAGHAAKNVTLGIPRLREIVMTASATIATPTMTLHVNPELPKEQAVTFAKAISKLSLAEVVDKITVKETLGQGVAYPQAKIYTVHLEFFPPEEYCKEYAIQVEDVARAIEFKLMPRLQKLIRTELKKKGEEKMLKADAKSDALPEIGKSAGTVEEARAQREGEQEGGRDDEGDDEDDDDNGDADGDATNSKQKSNRTENISYDAPDDEEEAIAAQGRRDATPEAESDDEDEGYGGSPRPNGGPGSAASEAGDDDEEADQKKLYAQERESRIKNRNTDVTSFKFANRGQWCEFTLEYDSATAKLLVLHLVENACRDAVIQAIPGLSSCMATTDKVDDKDVNVVMTEGVNLLAMRDFQDIINPNKLFTNDIAAMLRLYGVEACRANIVREMNAVFSGHGIAVDTRHLGLIADTMTKNGGYAAFSRNGLKTKVSPFMKMSFETTVGFLRDAVLDGDWDDLNNPSARIVVGKMSKVGTGAFDVLMPVA